MTNESKYKTFCKSPKAELLTPWVLPPSEPLGIHPWHFIFPELSLQFQQNPWVTSKGANSPIPCSPVYCLFRKEKLEFPFLPLGGSVRPLLRGADSI